jgi:hypothetical protein
LPGQPAKATTNMAVSNNASPAFTFISFLQTNFYGNLQSNALEEKPTSRNSGLVFGVY